MKKLVGIDIGATEVRVAEVSGIDARGQAIVTKIGLSPIKEGAIVGGQVKNPSDVALALQRAIKAAGVSKRGFILGMASPNVSLEHIELPSTIKKNEREQAIRIGEYPISPLFSLDKASIATQSISTEVRSGVQISTFAVASSLDEELEMLKKVCKLANCQPKAIDLSGAAILRSSVRLNPDLQEVATIVDIGASKVTVTTRVGPYMRSVRTSLGGGHDLTRALAAAMNESPEEAERRKHSMALSQGFEEQNRVQNYGFEEEQITEEEFRANLANKTLSNSAGSLVELIANLIESDAATIGAYTEGVALCGGGARLKGIKDKLHHRTGLKVAVVDPFLRIEHSKRNEAFFTGEKENPVIVMNLAVAVGLALWKEPS